MTEFVITLITIWVYPIVTFFMVKREVISKKIARASILITLIIVLGWQFNVTTINDDLDWFLGSLMVFALWLVNWRGVFHQKKYIAIATRIISIFAIMVSLLFGSVGLLGVAFIIGDQEFSRRELLQKNFIYKEQNKGNATSDWRIKNVLLYKKVSFFPLLERRVSLKSYDDLDIVFKELILDQSYDDKLILKSFDKDSLAWSDTLYFEYERH